MDKLLRLDLQHFAEEGEGGAGNQKTDPADNLEGQQQEPQQQDSQQQEDKLLPQSDVNNLIAKETKKTQEKLLKQLGIEDFKSAKEGLEKFREWQESQKTEAQKQSERLQEYETQSQKLANENESLKAQNAAILAGVQKDAIEDVVTLAKPLVSDEVDMNVAIGKVLEKYPHFKGEAEETSKPVYTTGPNQKQRPTEMDQWIQAFKQQ